MFSTTRLVAAAIPLVVLSAGSFVRAADIPAKAIGAYNNPGCCGSSPDFGYTVGVTTPGNPINGTWGLELLNTSLVSSFTLDQAEDPNRLRPNSVTVHTSPTTSFNVNLVDTQAPQVVTFPAPVLAQYLLLTTNTQYGPGGDSNWGIASLTAQGTVVSPYTNLNLGITPTSVGGLGGYDFPARTTNGAAVSQSSDSLATFLVRDAGQDSLKVDYSSPQDVGSVGIAFETYGNRDIPKSMTILDSNGGTQTITLAPDQLQFGRYTLPTPITGTTFLTVQFPEGSPDNFFVNGDANYGITEFQAFAPVPEPGSIAILGIALAGALGRRVR